ncbi:MAG: LysM peptidoglycan-binding domain-containing protein, partial [Actinomycetota bacterium]|nr:LysM peptidoglycan-binding domain-containing protein [Actinomycetota bacterium]
SAPSAARAAPAQLGVGSAGQTQEHLVVPGDNLWDIAARRVAEAGGGRRAELSPRDIHVYWTRVIAANRATLRSGDPNLIYPGEQVALPPLEGTDR